MQIDLSAQVTPIAKSIGATSSNFLVENAIGALNQGGPLRFRTLSPGPVPGLLGLHDQTSPSLLKDQPGVFPAPLIGQDSLEFIFTSQPPFSFYPLVIKPDGTPIQCCTSRVKSARRKIIVPYPAPSGIYTIFIVDDSSIDQEYLLYVEVKTGKGIKNSKRFSSQSMIEFKKGQKVVSEEIIYNAMQSRVIWLE